MKLPEFGSRKIEGLWCKDFYVWWFNLTPPFPFQETYKQVTLIVERDIRGCYRKFHLLIHFDETASYWMVNGRYWKDLFLVGSIFDFIQQKKKYKLTNIRQVNKTLFSTSCRFEPIYFDIFLNLYIKINSSFV